MVQYLKNIKFEVFFIFLFTVSNLATIFKRFAIGTTKDVFTDDAYYYILPAINFIEKGFYSFDGINKTNGFHPLFEWSLTILYKTTGVHHDPYTLYIIVLSFISLILVGLIFVVSKYALNIYSSKSIHSIRFVYLITAVLTILSSWYLDLYLNGMEAVLVIFLISILSIYIYHQRFLIAGLIGMLIVGSRLDTFIFFISPLALIYSLNYFSKYKPTKKALSTFLKLIVPSIVFVIVYMLMNYWSFGEFKPIHGRLKSAFPNFNFQPHLIMTRHVYIILSMALFGIFLNLITRNNDAKMKLLGISFGLITLLYLFNFGFFQKWTKMIPSWYYSIVYFTSFMSIASSIFGTLKIKYSRYLIMVFMSIVCVQNAFGLVKIFPLKNSRPPYGNTSGIFNFLDSSDESDVFAKTDTGALAFWSNRAFVNLDGLINNFEYQDYLKNGEFHQYFKDKNIRYIVADVWEKPVKDGNIEPMYQYRLNDVVYNGNYNSFSFYVFSYKYEVFSDKIELFNCSEVFRTPSYKDAGVNAVTIIYDLNINEKCSNLLKQ